MFLQRWFFYVLYEERIKMTEEIKNKDEMDLVEEPKTEMNSLLELAEETDYQVPPLREVQLNEGMHEPLGITEIKILLSKMDALSQLMFPDAQPMSFQLDVTQVFNPQYFDELEAEKAQKDAENELSGDWFADETPKSEPIIAEQTALQELVNNAFYHQKSDFHENNQKWADFCAGKNYGFFPPVVAVSFKSRAGEVLKLRAYREGQHTKG